MIKLISNANLVYNQSKNILIEPTRWCCRNISRINETVDGNLWKRIAIKIGHLAVGCFSLIALPITMPLTLVALIIEIAKGSHHTLGCDLQSLAKQQLQNMTPEQLDQDWKLKEFFGQIYVINLEQAKEKKLSFTENAKKVGLKEEEFTFFKATDGKKELSQELWGRVDNNYCDIDESTEAGRAALDKQHQAQAGCYMSHYRVIKEAKQVYEDALKTFNDAKIAFHKNPTKSLSEKLKEAEIELQKKSRVFIMEDDNAFGKVINDTPVLHHHNRLGDTATTEGVGKAFREGLGELPSDWDMLYLHSYQIFPNWEEAADSNKKICELKGGLTCNAYVINAKSFDKILKRLAKIEVDNQPLHPIDDEFAAMHKEGYIKAHGFHPSVTYQNTMGQSSIADSGDQVTSKKNCWQQAEWGRPVITYAQDGQRFGDQLVNFIKALYIANQHKLPLAYKPFNNSDQLVLSKTLFPYSQIAKKYKVNSNKLESYDPTKPLNDKDWNKVVQSSKELILSLKNWKHKLAQTFEVSFFTPGIDSDKWDNDDFRSLLQSLIKPINPLPSIEIPKDCCSVALHVRKGGGYDSDESIKSMPTKFPPDEYYTNAIKFLAEQNKGKKIYAFIFTDDPNPQAIVDKYYAAIKTLGIENEIEIGFRKNPDINNGVLADLFGMMQFENLVRPDSSLSQSAEAVVGPRISITPPAWNGWNQRDADNNLVVDRFKVNIRSEKGKGNSKSSIVPI